MSAQRAYDHEMPEPESPVCAEPCARCGASATLFGTEESRDCYAACNGCGRRAHGFRFTFEQAEEDWNEWQGTL